MRTATATPTMNDPRTERVELLDLLQRFETTQRDQLAALCESAGDSMQRLADEGQVPSYLVVAPQDPAPVVERTLLAALRRLSATSN